MARHVDYRALAEHVREHALQRYDKGDGWDMVIECMTAEGMAEEMEARGITTKRGAIAQYRQSAAIWAEHSANAGDW